MGITIIVRKRGAWAPRLMTLRLKPPRNRGGQTSPEVLVPGLGFSEKTQVMDILDKVNETHGRHHDEADIERGIEDA